MKPAAAAMGKDVTWQHLRQELCSSPHILLTLDGQTPVGYNPLRFALGLGDGGHWRIKYYWGCSVALFAFLIELNQWIAGWIDALMDSKCQHSLEGAAHYAPDDVGIILLLTFCYTGGVPVMVEKRSSWWIEHQMHKVMR